MVHVHPPANLMFSLNFWMNDDVENCANETNGHTQKCRTPKYQRHWDSSACQKQLLVPQAVTHSSPKPERQLARARGRRSKTEGGHGRRTQSRICFNSNRRSWIIFGLRLNPPHKGTRWPFTYDVLRVRFLFLYAITFVENLSFWAYLGNFVNLICETSPTIRRGCPKNRNVNQRGASFPYTVCVTRSKAILHTC